MSRPNWDVIFLRVCFVIILSALAAVLHPFRMTTAVSVASALGGAAVAIVLELRVRRAGLRQLAGGAIGLFAGGILGGLFAFLWSPGLVAGSNSILFVRIAVSVCCSYLGMLTGIANASRLNINALGLNEAAGGFLSAKVLDTSVLIDGRIADIAEAGFADGFFVIPRFVLHELQLVADSPDSTRRNRGRRGLDVVQRLQKLPNLQLDITNEDFPDTQQVDLKLIEWAKRHSAKIVTNDFNLNKLAQVQGVEVLNINELANALRPVVLPGESMRVFVQKEGKEHNQGVAYLDDGTMVVVDNARRYVSKTLDITVTSVLQTTAGKMIFGRYDERAQTTAAGQSR